MRLLGLSCGRRLGNSEILLKEALMGAEESGIQTDFIRMLDLDIKQCLMCKRCVRREKGFEFCPQKDDSDFMLNQVMDSDGFIISAPVYTLTPPGFLKALGDRAFGPTADVAFASELKKMRQKGENIVMQDASIATVPTGREQKKSPPPAGTSAESQQRQMKIDERLFKNRAGAFISVGGAPLHNWVSLGLPLHHIMTFSLQIAIADQLDVWAVADTGAVVLRDDYIKRARQLGRNVAKEMGKPFDDVKWHGDEMGTCPVCHTNLMLVENNSPIECAICGIKGDIKVDSKGKITVVFSEEEKKKSRIALEGKRIHLFEIMDVSRALEARKNEIPPGLFLQWQSDQS